MCEIIMKKGDKVFWDEKTAKNNPYLLGNDPVDFDYDLVKELNNKPKNKYMREILPNVWVDVYDVISAFDVQDGGMQHALKKILATGKRGHKDEAEDRKDILASVKRSNEIFNRGKQK